MLISTVGMDIKHASSKYNTKRTLQTVMIDELASTVEFRTETDLLISTFPVKERSRQTEVIQGRETKGGGCQVRKRYMTSFG